MLMGYKNWSKIPDNNAAVDPVINAKDRATARHYMPAIRGVMAGVATLRDDFSYASPDVLAEPGNAVGDALATKLDNGGSGNVSGMSVTASGAPVARTLAQRAEDRLSLADLGAVGDSTTNNLTALRAALTRGKDISIPAGVYRIVLPAGQGIGSIPAGMAIRGAGRSVSHIIIEGGSTAYFNAFSIVAAGVRFEDVTLDLRLPNGGSGTLFLLSGGGNDLSMGRVRLLGNITVTQSVPGDMTTGVKANTPYLFNIGGNFSDVLIDNSEIAGWHYTILKTNVSTATNRRWTFSNNYFHDNSFGHIAPNSPSGIWDGLTIANNTFGDIAMLTGSAGNSHMIGLASIWNVTITGNRFVGATSGEAIHVEEDTRNLAISGNVAEISSPFAGWGKFVQITDNNISGVRTAPSNVSIAGNVARRSDGVLDSVGIDIPYDGTSLTGAHNFIIEGNVIDGFATGIAVPELAQGSRVTGNVVRNFTVGLQSFSASADIRDNAFENGATGLAAFRGGLFGRQRFTNVAAFAVSSTGGVVGLRGWSQSFETSTVGSTTLSFNLGAIGKRFNGTIRTMVVANSSTDQEANEFAVSWDGSTITQTETWSYNGGGIVAVSATPFAVEIVSPFNFQFKPFVGGAKNNIVIAVEFDGLAIF